MAKLGMVCTYQSCGKPAVLIYTYSWTFARKVAMPSYTGTTQQSFKIAACKEHLKQMPGVWTNEARMLGQLAMKVDHVLTQYEATKETGVPIYLPSGQIHNRETA